MFDQVERKGGNNQLCTTLHTILEWDQCPFSYFISVKQIDVSLNFDDTLLKQKSVLYGIKND